MKIVIVPTAIPEMMGKKVYFLFSAMQVEDILREFPASPVPFSPSCVKGIVRWREHIVPVMSLEECLGFKVRESQESRRLITVRTKEERAMIRAGSGLRMLTLPIPCTPVPFPEWLPRPDAVRGVYDWQEGFLVAVYMDKILRGVF